VNQDKVTNVRGCHKNVLNTCPQNSLASPKLWLAMCLTQTPFSGLFQPDIGRAAPWSSQY